MNKEPWLDEADSVDWIDPTTGYRCAVRRTPHLLTLCGYVRLPRSHPLYRKPYDGSKAGRVDVHGGLTYAGRIVKPSKAPMLGYWFGFDCAHFNDLVPVFTELEGMDTLFGAGTVYRDIDYVMDQTTYLAEQLKAMEK